ncbi:GNAT family N-acetyltransferase [Hymenobacter psychrotolerans]|uniref:Predicted N-acyltransferase, GNAT family n=1 Tax=Hymenobacter psychrotolerans DSM 18569 TaxID=1121959 RepID=A0A1M6Z487_9BACT|nr:GNAT family N-acetyltransferase [Hymenobacter psychrotolerans]SHL25183.1 Predicted N-acyltransferase, GNAT family [Hymenobacter psychrotolerans DSM 18569]
MMTVQSPATPTEWAAYYQLRYEVLRQPWQQPPGSEIADDDAASTTTHALLLAPDGQALGVGRLHPSGAGQGQLRFMAVAPAAQGQGVGRRILAFLETAARRQRLRELVLHAREEAVPFYERLGYTVVAPSHLLFGVIPHFLMRKQLPDE